MTKYEINEYSKVPIVFAPWTDGGREFQAEGPATRNARSPAWCGCVELIVDVSWKIWVVAGQVHLIEVWCVDGVIGVHDCWSIYLFICIFRRYAVVDIKTVIMQCTTLWLSHRVIKPLMWNQHLEASTQSLNVILWSIFENMCWSSRRPSVLLVTALKMVLQYRRAVWW